VSSYSIAVAKLYDLGHELARTPSHKFDLAHMRVLLQALQHPEARFPSVLIAGTNGKGSTAAVLASITRAAGFKTALYSSPHLVRINERMRINGKAIDEASFSRIYEYVDQVANQLVNDHALPWHPSFFEMLTAMAFEYFAGVGVELAVLEVGMGGRLDATNVVEPLVSVITDVDLDHQKFLGDTIAEIAAEKAGIVRAGRATVTLPQHPQANDVLGRKMMEAGVKAVSAAKYVPPVSPGADEFLHASGVGGETAFRNRYPLTVMGEQILVDSPLVGRHQLRNIALAIAAAEELNPCGFTITPRHIEAGIRETRWPARFQVIPAISDRPEMVLDVAHNPAGAWALRSALSDRFPGRPVTLVFGMMHDKAVSDVVSVLFPVAERVVATIANNPRSASTSEIVQAAARTGAEVVESRSVSGALAEAIHLMRRDNNPLLVVSGSIYVVGEAMQSLGIEP
jgi:dihydrofolate synthase / folylpolyglutamate synthase